MTGDAAPQPRAHAETTDTPATRARANSLHQDADETRLYGREVTSDIPSSDQTDLRTPHDARIIAAIASAVTGSIERLSREDRLADVECWQRQLGWVRTAARTLTGT